MFVDPTRSANNTVTRLRSALRAEAAIDGSRACAPPRREASTAPHPPQKSKCAGLLEPQTGHALVSGRPHPPQNLDECRLSNAHAAHFKPNPLRAAGLLGRWR